MFKLSSIWKITAARIGALIAAILGITTAAAENEPTAATQSPRSEVLKQAVLHARTSLDSDLKRSLALADASPDSALQIRQGARDLRAACSQYLAVGQTDLDSDVLLNEAYALGIREGLQDGVAATDLVAVAVRVNSYGILSPKLFNLSSSAAKLRSATEKGLVEGLLAVRPFWGTNESFYIGMMMIAHRAHSELGEKLAHQIITTTNAPEVVLRSARDLLNRQWSVGTIPELKAIAIDGREVDLAAFRGKVVLLNFWATDCPPCVAELPELKDAYLKFKAEGFEVIGISLDRDKTAVQKLIKKLGIPWPIICEGEAFMGKVAKDFGIGWIPQNWLLDRQGRVQGFAEESTIEKAIRTMLSESGAK
jgi:peroxiredoxin